MRPVRRVLFVLCPRYGAHRKLAMKLLAAVPPGLLWCVVLALGPTTAARDGVHILWEVAATASCFSFDASDALAGLPRCPEVRRPLAPSLRPCLCHRITASPFRRPNNALIISCVAPLWCSSAVGRLTGLGYNMLVGSAPSSPRATRHADGNANAFRLHPPFWPCCIYPFGFSSVGRAGARPPLYVRRPCRLARLVARLMFVICGLSRVVKTAARSTSAGCHLATAQPRPTTRGCVWPWRDGPERRPGGRCGMQTRRRRCSSRGSEGDRAAPPNTAAFTCSPPEMYPTFVGSRTPPCPPAVLTTCKREQRTQRRRLFGSI